MAENIENNGCLQRDNAEHEGYVKASRSFNRIWKERDSAQPRLLEAILYKDNFNRAYKRVKANKGAPGIDGMTIEEALPYLKEHQQEITDRIYRGKYTPSPVRRVEIPKPDGGVRKLGIPTVIDRTLQQAITQQLVPIYEPLFADGSYGYRPNRSAKDAILKVKEYAEQGYTFAVVLDLSKYFDTLNHEILINLLRKNVKDERVVQLIKRYLKSGVMENGVVIDTEEGSPQGGNLSPLLANVYLNEFDQEFLKRGVPCIRYADDIVLLAKSKRASERLLESSTKYLEERLKLRVRTLCQTPIIMICLNADVVILWTRSVLTIHLKEDTDTMTDTTEQFVLMKCEKCGYTENVPIHDILILRQLTTPDDTEDHLLCPSVYMICIV